MDLERPSDRDRARNLQDTAKQLGMRIDKKNESAFLSSQAQKKKDDEVFLQYTPANATGGSAGTRII